MLNFKIKMTYQDGLNVEQQEDIEGMAENMFLFNHKFEENSK